MLSADIDDELVAGVYHYLPHEHALERRCRFAGEVLATVVSAVAPGGTLVGLSSVHWREAWKYGERAFRYCQHDAGHAIGSLRLAARVLGWRLRVLASPSDALVAALLGLDRRDDFAGAEPEHPDGLMLLDPTGRAATDDRPRRRARSGGQIGGVVRSRQLAQPGARAMASDAKRRRGCGEAEESVRRRPAHAADRRAGGTC